MKRSPEVSFCCETGGYCGVETVAVFRALLYPQNLIKRKGFDFQIFISTFPIKNSCVRYYLDLRFFSTLYP